MVSTVTVPPAGASHFHQTDFPPALPAWFGSPGSFVAPSFPPVKSPPTPPIRRASEKESFVGVWLLATNPNTHVRNIPENVLRDPCFVLKHFIPRTSKLTVQGNLIQNFMASTGAAWQLRGKHVSRVVTGGCFVCMAPHI